MHPILNLHAKNIHKTFNFPVKTTILKGIDLEVMPGETVAIMGRSGEGKSTLLHILGTLEKPCEGKLAIEGEEVSPFNRTRIRNTHIGFVFQAFHLLEDYTVIENVLMPARIARISVSRGSESWKRAFNLLKRVGLEERIDFNVKQLSGGEKQRVAIARALCNDPGVLLADEPSGNLDRQNAEKIYELLFSFVEEENNGVKKTLIVVTHDEELARRCSRRYRLEGGVLKPFSIP